MTEAPSLNNASASDTSAHLLVPRDIPTSVPVNLDAGIYEAAVERLVKDGSCRAEGDLNALLSQFLAYVAAQGADAGSESIGMNDGKVRSFREARKKQVAEESDLGKMSASDATEATGTPVCGFSVWNTAARSRLTTRKAPLPTSRTTRDRNTRAIF